jgi:hypothetical protein
MVAIPQMSVAVADPVAAGEVDPSQLTVMLAGQEITGARLSSTVTIALAVDTLPLLSVTVNTTVFAPTSEQLNVDLLIVIELIAQLSKLPLLIEEGVMETSPLLFN